MKRIKYFYFVFEFNNQVSVYIKAETIEEATSVFKATFGEFLFSHVKQICSF